MISQLRDRARQDPPHEPHTNGVVERYGGTLKYERLYRHDIRDGLVSDEAPDPRPQAKHVEQ